MRTFLLTICIVTLSACAASFKVARVDPENSSETPTGFRFHLPKKYVLVEPKSDGSVSARFIYLPDYDHEFAVSSHTRLQNNTLSVTVANGLLTELGFTEDNTAAANKLIEEMGKYESARNKAESTAATAAATASAASAKALQDAYNAAELAFFQASTELDLLTEAYPDPNAEQQAKILAATIATEKAKLALQQAESRLNGIVDSLANAPTTAYGPALFLVDESRGNVKLVPVQKWHPDDALQLRVAVEPRPEPDETEVIPSVEICFEGKQFLDLFQVEQLLSEGSRSIRLTWRDEAEFVNATVQILKNGQEIELDTMQAPVWQSSAIALAPPEPALTVNITRINGMAGCNRSQSLL